MNPSIIVILGIFTLSICNAREPNLVIDLYSGDAPNYVAGGKAEVIVNKRIRHVSKPQIMVWFPSKRPTNGSTMIICPGGGYFHLAMHLHAENVVKYFNEKGITVIGLKYRTRYGKNDVTADALADGERAIRMVRSKAKEWKLAPNRIGIQGYSAGANLCINLAGNFDGGLTHSTDPVERFSSRPDFIALMCPWPNGKNLAAYPIKKTAPPTFIAHARDDKVARFSFGQGLSDKFKKLGIPCRLLAIDKGGHSAFHYSISKSLGATWPKTFTPWLSSINMVDKK